MKTIRERIDSAVSIVPITGCWMWMRRINRKGYGVIAIGAGRVGAHRASYQAFVGPIPIGMEIDHKCRNRWCVSPSHLEPVTQLENQRRSPISNSGKVTCKRGHVFDDPSTYVWRGVRICRVCRRLRERGEV